MLCDIIISGKFLWKNKLVFCVKIILFWFIERFGELYERNDREVKDVV